MANKKYQIKRWLNADQSTTYQAYVWTVNGGWKPLAEPRETLLEAEEDITANWTAQQYPKLTGYFSVHLNADGEITSRFSEPGVGRGKPATADIFQYHTKTN